MERKNIRVDETLFTAIKSLLNAGATYADVNKFYGVCTHTAQFVKKADSFDDYKRIVAEKVAKNNANKAKRVTQPVVTPQVVEHKQTVTVQATWAMMEEMKKTNELLKLISNKLVYIVEQLT